MGLSVLSIRQFLAKWNITGLEQPAYPPDLAPCDLVVFHKFRVIIKETHFERVEAIQENRDNGTEGYSRRIILAVYRNVEEKDE